MRSTSVAVGLMSMALGCAVDVDLSETTSAIKKQPGDCETYGCGGNSPEAEGKLFWAQHELGLPNNEGIRIQSFAQKIGTTWHEYRPDVLDGMLLARDKITNTIILKGSQLVGSRFILEDTIDHNHYYVTVAAVGETPMWAQRPWPGKQSPDYELSYYSDTNPLRRNLCKAAGTPTGDTMNPFRAVLFDDDRVDPDGLSFGPEEADWFTIGCAGSALAKMHLTGNTKAGGNIVGAKTLVTERTGFLKMLTSDYCGTGHAFTVAKMPLHYRDVYGHMSSVAINEEIEGRWDKTGAICVGKPRAEASPTTLSIATFGYEIDDELAEFGCTLPPPCAPPLYATHYPYNGAYVISTNY